MLSEYTSWHSPSKSQLNPNSFLPIYSEILRTIDSLQLTDRLKVVATPANWTVSID